MQLRDRFGIDTRRATLADITHHLRLLLIERTQSLFGFVTKAHPGSPIPEDPDPRDFADEEDPRKAWQEACSQLDTPRWRAMSKAESVGSVEELDAWLGGIN